jgi:hypothetical protein
VLPGVATPIVTRKPLSNTQMETSGEELPVTRRHFLWSLVRTHSRGTQLSISWHYSRSAIREEALKAETAVRPNTCHIANISYAQAALALRRVD